MLEPEEKEGEEDDEGVRKLPNSGLIVPKRKFVEDDEESGLNDDCCEVAVDFVL